MTQLKLPQTIKCKVVRPFTYKGKAVAVGDELDLAYVFGREMLASHKVESTEWPPKSGPDVKDLSIPGAPSAATAKEADNARKQDKARSPADQATIKDEAAAEKRNKP